MTNSPPRSANHRGRNRASSGNQSAAVLNSVLTIMRSIAAHCVDMRDALHLVRRTQERIEQNEAALVRENHNNLHNIGKCFTELREDLQKYQTCNRTGSTSPEQCDINSDDAKEKAKGCIDYVKVIVSSAMLGKGSLWDFYCSEFDDSVLVAEANQFVFRELTEEGIIDAFLGSYSLADRSGVTKVFHRMSLLMQTITGSLKQSEIELLLQEDVSMRLLFQE